LRYFNVAGADQSGEIGEDHQPETHLIPNIIKVAQGLKEKAFIFGDDFETRDGTCLRDYIHIDDLISAHMLALKYLENKENSSEIMNLGSSVGFTVKEVVESVRKIT
jgi:UDP-glucose 4-epimerase